MSGLTGTTYRTKLVHMENNIQKARDVLAKWRDYIPSTTGGRWHISGYEDAGGHTHIAADSRSIEDLGFVRSYADATLIVGTAGNPELLDAVGDLLATAVDFRAHLVRGFSPGPLIQNAERIAAAIIAADERMSA